MASANLDLVRSIYAAWERGDFGSAAWARSDIEFVARDGLEVGATTGVAAMAEGWRASSTWQRYRVEAVEYRELDNDRLLVLMQHGGRGKASGLGVAQLTREGASVFDLRDGKVARLAVYWDRERALADVGLAREGGAQR